GPAKHRFNQDEAEGFRILNRIQERARSTKEFVSLRTVDRADVLDSLSVNQRLNLLAKIGIAWTGHEQTQTESLRHGNGLAGAFSGNKSSEVTDIIVRLLPESERRDLQPMRYDGRGAEMR